MLKFGYVCMWFVLVWFVFSVACCVAFVSCAPAMPTCGTAGVWRCDGTQMQMCTGEQWSTRHDCSQIGLEDGGLMEQQCVENDGLAGCV